MSQIAQTTQQVSDDELVVAKAAIMELLTAAGYVKATIEYDGCDDNGQMNCMTVFDSKGHTTELSSHAHPPEVRELFNALDELAWQVLDACHPGFENNDGGHGTLTVDVANNSLRLEHSSHYVAYDDYGTVVKWHIPIITRCPR